MDPGKPRRVGSPQTEGRPPPCEPAAGKGAVTAWPLTKALTDKERRRGYFALMVLTAGALYLSYIIYRPFLRVLFLALVLTIAFWPVDRWIGRRVRGATMRALITMSLVILVILLPLTFVSVSLFSEAASLYGYVNQKLGGNWSGHSAVLTEAIQRISDQTGIPSAQLKATITARAQDFGSWLVGIAGWAARGSAQQAGAMILTLLIMFFFL